MFRMLYPLEMYCRLTFLKFQPVMWYRNMEKGCVQVFCGTGEGKSSAAIGKGLLGALDGKSVIIVQFLKAKNEDENSFLQRMEPEFKYFRFQKHNRCFEDLNDEEKLEEITNIKNGFNYAKKVLTTGECDILILDEILGLVDKGIICNEEMIALFEARGEDVSIILTGINLPESLKGYVDNVSKIQNVDFK